MKPRTGPPPVDQLPDVAWARVERELWTRLDHSAPAPAPERRRWMWIAVSIAAAAAAVAIVFAIRGSSAPTAGEPARIVAGASPSSVSFGDAHIALDARSAVVMEADRHTALLENGAAWFAVGPRGDRPAFVVHAGDATVRVVGTRFRVARDKESVSVAVDHGVVAVDFHDSHVELGAGRSWSSAAPDTVAIASAPPAPTVVAPVSPIPPVTSLPAPSPSPSVQIAPKPLPTCDADCAHYKALAKVEATHPEVAMKGYLALSQGSGTWAAVALFAAGRLAADRHDPRAPSLLSIYLTRFPSGANAADATELLARLKGTSP